jgi:hypothetical protein
MEWVSNNNLFSRLNSFFNKLIIDRFMNKGSGSSYTALTMVKEKGKLILFDSKVKVSIMTNNIR